MKIEAVFLDAGNTLFTERRTRDEMYTAVLRDRGADVTLEQVADWRESLHHEMPDDVDGHGPYTPGWFREFVTRLLVRAGCPADPEEVRSELSDHFSRPESFQLFPDTLPALDVLRHRGMRLAVVSNWSDRLSGLIDGLGLVPYFEIVAISAVVGHTKPDVGLFRHVLAELGLPPESALHVGDHPVNDVQAAERTGLRALLIDRDGRHATGAGVIRSLLEVERHLVDD